MGQVNLPILNRTGYSVFWQSCFDDKLNYRKLLHSSIISKKIVSQFFRDSTSKSFFFLKKKKIFKISTALVYKLKGLSSVNSTKIYKNIDNIINYSLKKKFLYSSKKIPSYNTKLFFIKYNNWIIITFRLYVPISKVLKRRLKFKKIKESTIISNFWKFFYINLYKNKLNLTNLNRSPDLEF